jgi:hypothetical protein
MSKKRILFSAVAALLALAAFSFIGCNAPLGEGTLDATSGDPVSRSIGTLPGHGIKADLTGRVYICDIGIGGKYGMSRIDFISSTEATGVLGNSDHNFIYVVTAGGIGILQEPSAGYAWSISVGSDYLDFTNGFDPYTGNAVRFDQITIQTSANLEDLTGTLWLGRGPRGESLLDQVVYSTSTGNGTLQGTFGPDTPNPFTFTYKYDASTGTGAGNMSSGAGDFASSDATATLTFPNFWGHGVQVVFNKFTYN